MQIISIELLNDNALSLLKELEVLNILRLVKTEEVVGEITDAHKAIIDGRLADYRANPDNALDWEDVKRELPRKWSGTLSDETADKMLEYTKR